MQARMHTFLVEVSHWMTAKYAFVLAKLPKVYKVCTTW